MPDSKLTSSLLTRRSALLAGTVVLAAYALLRTGMRLAFSPSPERTRELKHLSPRQQTIAAAMAQAMAGDEAALLLDKGWDPVLDLNNMLQGMNPAVRQQAAFSLYLVEEWGLGIKAFHEQALKERRTTLENWRRSPFGIQRSLWGLYHAAFGSSFGSRAAWKMMGYPGPCVPRDDGFGRPPGQSALFDWDSSVP